MISTSEDERVIPIKIILIPVVFMPGYHILIDLSQSQKHEIVTYVYYSILYQS